MSTTETTEPKSATKSPRININLMDAEVVSKFNQLKGDGKSNPEFIAELLEAYEKFSGKNCSTESDEFFKNITGTGNTLEERTKHKNEKETALRKMFDLDEKDPLLMSECDLLAKASDCSGKSIEDMALEGRILVAKNEIGRHIQYGLGKGKKGSGDEQISQMYDFMKQAGQKISLNRLTQRSGSNRKTVERWCKDNNITIE